MEQVQAELDQEEEKEEITTSPSETPDSEDSNAQLQAIRKELEEERNKREQLEERTRDLGARLTRSQQESAEFLRFHKATLPRINKSFAERWEEDPEAAVKEAVSGDSNKNTMEVARMKARQAELDLLIREPELTKYQSRVKDDLGNKYWEMTQTESGIEALYRMAEAEDLRSQVKKAKANGKAEAEKERAFTEGGSTPKTPQKRKLNSAQMKIAEELDISPDEYLKQLER
jgi:hypothetical protein